ncbi:MAG: sensor histidine kinase [Actinomycetota bacterium]
MHIEPGKRWNPTAPLPLVALVTLGAPGIVTLLAIPREHPPTTVMALLYVLAVLVAVRVGGPIAGIAASILSFLSLNFFFTDPLHTFIVGTIEDLVALLVFLVVAVTVGLLLSSAVSARANVERRELSGRLMNRVATRLLSGEVPEVVLRDLARGLCEMLHLDACQISVVAVGEVIVGHAREAQAGEEFRLLAGTDDIGAIQAWGRRGRLSADEENVLRVLATQLALALQGMRLSAEVRKAELEAHSTRLKAALFSGVTHDVKTPLGAILTSVTSLIDGRDFSNEERWDHLDTIKQEAERLHRLVNNLLDIGRLRSGALVVQKKPSPIDELLESVINRLRSLLQGREVELRVADDVPEVPMDVVQVDQVVTNLIENAIKFTPDASPISLLAVGDGECVRVTVTDRGPGVGKDDRRRIFEPFERGSSTASGTGLGLAVADAIVQAHGGRMWVSQSPAGGAAFTFELPSEDAVEEEVGGVPARARR